MLARIAYSWRVFKLGTLDWRSVTPGLVASPVARALAEWDRADDVHVAPIDPGLADTAEFCERYDVSLKDSLNCVLIAGKRGETVTYAACLILATSRTDVNGVARRRLNAKKASFAPIGDAVALSGMEYGGITPIGLPDDWPILIDRAALDRELVVIGSGLRRSKLALPPTAIADMPAVEVIDDLAR